jgi:hypothetical protein
MLGVGRGRSERGWYPWSQAHMNSAMVVMFYPTVEKVFEMPLSQRDEEIQALAAYGSDRSHRAFAWGARSGGKTRTPIAATALSNSKEKMRFRSWMRKWNGASPGSASRNCCMAHERPGSHDRKSLTRLLLTDRTDFLRTTRVRVRNSDSRRSSGSHLDIRVDTPLAAASKD